MNQVIQVQFLVRDSCREQDHRTRAMSDTHDGKKDILNEICNDQRLFLR